MQVKTYENWGRVVFHENGGYTVVEITDKDGVPLNVSPFQVATECIPREFRPIGSRFLFQWGGTRPEDGDSVDEIRSRCRQSCRVLRPAPD